MDRDKEEQEVGYSMEKNEISAWLNRDTTDPGFQLMTDDEICDQVLSEMRKRRHNPMEIQTHLLSPTPWQLICLISALHG